MLGNTVIYLIMVSSFTLSVSMNAVVPIQPLFMFEVGVTEIELGLIFAFSSLLGLASRIPLGILSDKVDRWLMMIIASVIQLVFFLAFSLTNRTLWFYPLMAIQAMIWGFFGPPAIALVLDMTTPTNVGRVMGLYYTSIGLGQFIGPLACSFLTTIMPYRNIFSTLSFLPILGLLATMGCIFIGRRTRRSTREEGVPAEKRGIVDSFKRILGSRNVIGLCLSRVIFSIAAAVIGTLFSVWANTELFFTASTISLIFSVQGATNASIRMPIGRIVDKIGRKNPMIIAFSMAATTFLILSLTGDLIVVVCAMAMYGLAWGIRIVPDTAILTDSVDPKDRGLALAILMSMFATGSTIGSFMAGVMYTVIPMSMILQISAGVLCLGALLIAVIITEERGR